jgi:hypothetical protein
MTFNPTHLKYFRLVLLFIVALSSVHSASPEDPGIDPSLTLVSTAGVGKKKYFRPLKTVKKVALAVAKLSGMESRPSVMVQFR